MQTINGPHLNPLPAGEETGQGMHRTRCSLSPAGRDACAICQSGSDRGSERIANMKSPALNAIGSVAYKEFLHIYRDRRILVLLLVLPPLFTVIFGHAFENTELTDVPALLIDRDQTPRASRLIDLILKIRPFSGEKHRPVFKEDGIWWATA